MRYTAAAAYLTVGLVLHFFFVGTNVDPLSAWTWLWLVGWLPMLGLGGALMLFGGAALTALGAAAVALACIAFTVFVAAWGEA